MFNLQSLGPGTWRTICSIVSSGSTTLAGKLASGCAPESISIFGCPVFEAQATKSRPRLVAFMTIQNVWHDVRNIHAWNLFLAFLILGGPCTWGCAHVHQESQQATSFRAGPQRCPLSTLSGVDLLLNLVEPHNLTGWRRVEKADGAVPPCSQGQGKWIWTFWNPDAGYTAPLCIGS